MENSENLNASNQTEYVITISDSDGSVVTTSLYAQLADIVEERHTWIEF